jgi:hypothetical protein
MGTDVEDRDFYAIIIGSLPESYRPLLSSINAAARVTQTPITPYKLISIVSEEYEHRMLTECRPTKKGGNSALAARSMSNRPHALSNSTMASPDITCFNCDRKGHYKQDCWRKGGGQEGQGPRQNQKKGGCTPKHSANSATDSKDPDSYAFMSSDLISIADQLKVPMGRHGAIIDSGASAHFCPDRTKFKNFVSIPSQNIHTADGTTVSAIGRGDVSISLPLGSKWTSVTLKDMLYAPDMAFTLVSTN